MALGTVLAGWLGFRLLKGKARSRAKNQRRHARDLELKKRIVFDEIDYEDPEVLEFLEKEFSELEPIFELP